MTRDQAREFAAELRAKAALAQAYADGAELIHCGVLATNPDFTNHSSNYLIANKSTSAPQKPRLRPWRPEEVPVGAQLICCGWPGPSLILSADTESLSYVDDKRIVAVNYDIALDACRWRTPQSEAWLPCGVEDK